MIKGTSMHAYKCIRRTFNQNGKQLRLISISKAKYPNLVKYWNQYGEKISIKVKIIFRDGDNKFL